MQKIFEVFLINFKCWKIWQKFLEKSQSFNFTTEWYSGNANNWQHAKDDSFQNKHTEELYSWFSETTFLKCECLIKQFIRFSGIIFQNGGAYCISQQNNYIINTEVIIDENIGNIDEKIDRRFFFYILYS